MYRFQTLSKEQLVNAVLCFADRISCNHCPCKTKCLDDLGSAGLCCESFIIDYLTEEIPEPKTPDYYEGFNEGFNAGYEACKKAIIDKLQKGRMKNNEDSR